MFNEHYINCHNTKLSDEVLYLDESRYYFPRSREAMRSEIIVQIH